MARLKHLALAVLALCALTGAGAGAAAPPPDTASAGAADQGAAYLASTQGDDGAIAAGWRPDQVAEAVMAVHLAGGQDGAVARALDFLAANGDAGASNGPFAGRIVSALVSVGENPRSFGGVNYVARVKSFYEPATGEFGGPNLYADTLAMLGLLAAGEPLPDQSLNRLLLTQCDDGGWTHAIGCQQERDVDTTAAALAVVAGVRGAGDEAARDARAWLVGARNEDTGCWGYADGAKDNANSCALALNAVTALGEDPHAAPWAAGGKDPTTALRALQLPSGAFRYMANKDEPNTYATVQTVFALAGGWYPTRAPAPPPTGDDDDQGPPPVTGTTRPGGGSATGGDDDGGSGLRAPGGDPAGPAAPARPASPGDPGDPGAGTTTTAARVKGSVLSALGIPAGDGGEGSDLPDAPGSGDPVTVTDTGGVGGGRGPALAVAAGLLGAVGSGVAWWGRRRGGLAALGFLGVALVAVPLAGVAATPEPCLAAPGEINVRVVVDYGTLEGSPGAGVTTTCVTVPAGATGADVLEARADKLRVPGPRYDASGLLCAIDGYPASGCGEQTATGYKYWGYYQGSAEKWKYAQAGPAEQNVSADVTEGWRFNNGEGPENPPPRAKPDPGCTAEDLAAPKDRDEEDAGDSDNWVALAGLLVAGFGGLAFMGWYYSRRRQGT